MDTIEKTVYTARLGLEFVDYWLLVFAWFICIFSYSLYCLWQLGHFSPCFGAGVANVKEPPPPWIVAVSYYNARRGGYLCRCVIHYCIGDAQDSPGVSASEITIISWWTVTAYVYNTVYSELTACNRTLTRWLQARNKQSHLCVTEQWPRQPQVQ